MQLQKKRARGATALVIVAIVGLLASGCTPRVDTAVDSHGDLSTAFGADITEKLNAALTEGIALSAASGGVAEVWAPWGGKWVAALGTTAIGGSAPMEPDAHFRIGGVTKPMTCTVLLRLVDVGTVKLSDPVSKYLTRMPGADTFTLGELCQGTSGLADYRAELSRQFVHNPKRVWPPLEVLSTGVAMSPTAGPGEAWSDSNTGLMMLGLALQAATGQDWPSLYEQYVFEPLQMTETSMPQPTDFALPLPSPHGYAASINADDTVACEPMIDVTELSNSMDWVAGGVVSTVSDLSRWTRTLAAGSLLSEASATAQWATIPRGTGAASWQGYGLGVQQIGPMRGHSGAISGFLSAAYADQDSGLTVVVALNNSTAGAGFAETLALRLVAAAAKAPAVGELTAPTLELPWSEEQTTAEMQAAAVCQPPAG